MRMKITLLLMLLAASMVKADIAFHLLWEVSGEITDIHVSDLNGDGYQELLLATGTSHEKKLSTPTGSVTAVICEGLVSQYNADSTLKWEKKLCKNDAAADPCYSNGCISTLYADTICTTTQSLLFVGCCYCGQSSIVRVYNSEGVLLHELYDDGGGGVPANIPGCIRKILAADIDADNCKEIIVATNLELFIYDTDCNTCTIPMLPTYRSRDLPVASRPSGVIYDVIVVNFDDDASPTKEIVVAADQVSVYEHDLVLKWQYEVDTSWPVTTLYSFDVDSDTAAHEIDQDPDLEPELIVGESWYIYVLDNIEYANTNPADDDPNLKWEFSTSPYDVNTVFAGPFSEKRNIMGGAASLVYVLDYNGTLVKSFNASSEVQKLQTADFDDNGQNELVAFSTDYVTVFSTTSMMWNSPSYPGIFIDGVVADINLDGDPEIVAAYREGVHVIGRGELTSVTDSEAERLYNSGKELMEKGDFVRAVIFFEQARAKYEEAGNTFMVIQCQKRVSECEKFMDTDRIVATALEELRNYGYEKAGILFGEAASLYAKVNDKSKMSQMRMLKEASENLHRAHESLLKAHELLLEENWSKAKAEATWSQHSFEDVSGMFLTLSLDSLYETLNLDISDRIRECEDVVQLCDEFTAAESAREEADHFAQDADRYFRNQLYSEAYNAYQQAEEKYTEAAQSLEEIQMALGRRVDRFERDIQDIEGKIKTLKDGELYMAYEDIQISQIIQGLQERKNVYASLVDSYEDLAQSVERDAKDSRTKASTASNQAAHSYSLGDQFIQYAKTLLQPPTSLAVGLACLIVALIGIAVGKGKYIALVFLVLVLIFLGVSVLQVWGVHLR